MAAILDTAGATIEDTAGASVEDTAGVPGPQLPPAPGPSRASAVRLRPRSGHGQGSGGASRAPGAITHNVGATADSAGSTTTTQAITVPAGVKGGDVVLVYANAVVLTATAPAITASSTGTSPVSAHAPVTGTESFPAAIAGAVWQFKAAGTLGAASPDVGKVITVSAGATSVYWSVALYAYTGCNSAAPVDVINGAYGGANSNTVTCPVLSTGKAGDWAVYLGGGAANGGSFAGPSGSTQRESDNSSVGVAAGIFDGNGPAGAAGASIGGGHFTCATASTAMLVGFTVGLAAAIPAPFTPPASPRPRPSASTGSGTGSAGATWTAPGPPSAFTLPSRAASARASARKGSGKGTAGRYTFVPPGPLAPFSLPHHVTDRHPSARRGSSASSAGAPFAYTPTPPPAPFAVPVKASKGAAAARKGAGRGLAGARAVVTRALSPFTLPSRAVKGAQPRKRTGTSRGSTASAWYVPLRQQVSGSTTGTTLTLTFPLAAVLGNSVIITLAGYSGGTVSNITIGGAGGAFSKKATSGGYNAEVWADLGITASSATLVITTSTAGISAWAYEVTGNVAFDVSAGTFGTGIAWSSGNTPETVPYGHFVVGLGMVTANTGTITPAAGGWNNGPAHLDVAGAATVGAVSGYRTAPGAGAYVYSGTSAASSGWAAVTAAFLVTPFASAQYYGNWGGYVFNEHAAYTGITATFTVPSCSGGAYDSLWVGLGAVYQAGIYQTYTTGQPGNSSTRPWSFWLPGAGEDWNAAAFPTAYGDTLTLTMQLTAVNWLMTITNVTQGWTYTEVKSVLAVNTGSVHNNGAGPAQWIFPLGSAEVIIEREGVALPHYGSVAFTGIQTVPPSTQLPYQVFTVNAAVDQYPGPYSQAGGTGSFTMTWNAES